MPKEQTKKRDSFIVLKLGKGSYYLHDTNYRKLSSVGNPLLATQFEELNQNLINEYKPIFGTSLKYVRINVEYTEEDI